MTISPSNAVSGWVAPGFERVKAAFEVNFTQRGDLGAAFAAVRDGRPVVDLWAGSADREHGRPWQEDTLGVIFSGTKGLVALCVNMLADRGMLDVDAPVSRYWPEFAAHNKGQVRVTDVLTHSARLPGVRTPLSASDLLDDRRMAALVAAQPQETDQRAVFCYHALTLGWLCGELVRRIDGRSIGRFFNEEVAGPLGLDAWIGLPSEHEPRVARLVIGPGSGGSPTFDPAQCPGDALFQSVWGNPPLFRQPLIWNAPAVHAAEIPGVNAVASARSLARLYGVLAAGGSADGVRLISQAALARARHELMCKREPLVDAIRAYGLGFAVKDPEDTELGPPQDAFGHSGAGGSRHGAWPSKRVGFSYITNDMRDMNDDARGQSLLTALDEVTAG